MSAARGAWVLVAPATVLPRLEVLRARHALARPVVVHARSTIPRVHEWADLLPAGAAGVLVVGDRRHSPRTAVPGLFVASSDGAAVPIGWLPLGSPGVDSFVAAATSVLGRTHEGPVAVLGQRSARYQRLGERLVHHLGSRPSVRWGAERLTREDVCAALRVGLGPAVYLGHGRPTGWAGYRGLRAEHLRPVEERDAHPLGCLVSVTCWTASRWRTGASFSEQVVLQGSAASALGAIRPVEHLASTRVVVALASTIRAGAGDVASLLRGAFLAEGRPVPEARDVRLVGDPLAGLGAEPGAARRAAGVFAPPPDLRPQDGPVTEEVA